MYEGAAREAIARLKYRNARAPLDLLVQLLDGALPEHLWVECVTWVPASRPRRARSGFDHAELLARGIARRRGLPVGRLLERGDARPQTTRGSAGRRVGPLLVVSLPRGAPPPRSVLVVDDVATTGATLRNAATALASEGCEWVIGAVVARTLLKPSAGGSETPIGRGAATPGTPN